MITQEYLQTRLEYDPDTGVFKWKSKAGEDRETKRWNARYAGRIAGAANCEGYINIGIDGRSQRAHRMAWLYMTGSLPNEEIDHINSNRGDNRFENLRPANRSQNMANIPPRKRFKGVSRQGERRGWKAQICHDGQLTYLGTYSTEETAYAAYCDAADRLHGEFARYR